MSESEVQRKGAINNGVTPKKVRAIIHGIGIYCGVQQVLACFHVARSILVLD